jgi:hypothetical protein
MNRHARRAAAARARTPHVRGLRPGQRLTAEAPADQPPGVRRAFALASALLSSLGSSAAAQRATAGALLVVQADDDGPVTAPTGAAHLLFAPGAILRGPGYEASTAPLEVALARLGAFEPETAATIRRVALPGRLTMIGIARDGSYFVAPIVWVDLDRPAGVA